MTHLNGLYLDKTNTLYENFFYNWISQKMIDFAVVIISLNILCEDEQWKK
jgi:hypothetical protein